MRYLYIIIIIILQYNMATAQEKNSPNKKLWAKSMLNKKYPTFKVDKWVNMAPKDTKGKFILLHYWSPARPWGAYLSIPRMNRLSIELKKDLQVIGITNAAAEFVEDIVPTINYPYASAPKMVSEIQLKYFCYAFLINPNGIVIWEGCPYLEGQNLTDKELKRLIKKYENK